MANRSKRGKKCIAEVKGKRCEGERRKGAMEESCTVVNEERSEGGKDLKE